MWFGTSPPGLNVQTSLENSPQTRRFNLAFSPLVAFPVISWSIYMTDTFTQAAEPGGAPQLNTTCGMSLLFELMF